MYRNSPLNRVNNETGRLPASPKISDSSQIDLRSQDTRKTTDRLGFKDVQPYRQPMGNDVCGAFTSPSIQKVEVVNTSARIHVELVCATSRLSSGDIVAFEFVSNEKKWKWSIGTVLGVGNSSEKNKGANSTECSLITLTCWELTADIDRDSVTNVPGSNFLAKENNAIGNVREKKREIEMERAELLRSKYVEHVVRDESIVDALREDLRNADKKQWAEILQIQMPPPTLRLVMQAVFAILRIELLFQSQEEEWERMLRFIRSDAFTEILSDSSASKLDVSLAEAITQKYLNNPLFAFTKAEAISRLVGLMQKWVVSEVQLCKSSAEAHKIEARLQELDKELVQKNVELRWFENFIDNVTGDGRSDHGENMQYILKSFTDIGHVAFVRTLETTLVVRSSIFCKIIFKDSLPLASKPNIITIQRRTLIRMCDAATRKIRHVTFDTPSKEVNADAFKFLHSTHQVEMLCEQSYERVCLMLQEVVSLYEMHVLYTTKLMRILSGVNSAPMKFTSCSPQDSITKLSPSPNRVNELEEALRQNEEFHRLQEGYTEEINRLQQQVRRNAAENHHLRSSYVPLLKFNLSNLEHSEEIARMQLAADEMKQWSTLLMHEACESKNLALLRQNQEYLQDINSARQELSLFKNCHARAISILKKCFGEMEGMWGQQLTDTSLKCRAGVEQAITVLNGLNTYTNPVALSKSHLKTEHVNRDENGAYDPPFLASASGRVGKKNIVKADMDTKPEEEMEENITALRDHLFHVMQDRALLEKTLSGEQERSFLLERQLNAKHVELEREIEKRIVLDKMILKLQGNIDAMSTSMCSSTCRKLEKVPTDEDLKEHRRQQRRNQEEEDQKTIARLQSVIDTYERELADLLAEEGVEGANVSFASLRRCMSHLKDSCVAMQAERDAQSSDAKMLESCLKTAADALENALLHDERWRPRTTKSDHTTWHWKTFPGNDWGRVIAETPEALHIALVHDIAFACHLPDEYVMNLAYRDQGTEIHVSFDLLHDPSISAEEIICRLNECNFYEMDKLYAQRLTPKQGIDSLRKELHTKKDELQGLQKFIAGLKNDSNISLTTSPLISAFGVSKLEDNRNGST